MCNIIQQHFACRCRATMYTVIDVRSLDNTSQGTIWQSPRNPFSVVKCITDIKIIIHPSVWHVCVPLHRLVFMAASFYNGSFFPNYITKMTHQTHTHSYTTQLEIISCHHSFDTHVLEYNVHLVEQTHCTVMSHSDTSVYVRLAATSLGVRNVLR